MLLKLAEEVLKYKRFSNEWTEDIKIIRKFFLAKTKLLLIRTNPANYSKSDD